MKIEKAGISLYIIHHDNTFYYFKFYSKAWEFVMKHRGEQ